MEIKKIIVFILCSFIPMIGIGIIVNLYGSSSTDITSALIRMALSSFAMMLPMIATIITQLIFKEPVLKGLDISFRINRWWVIGWLLMPVIAMVTLGVTLLMPGAKWTPDSETINMTLQSMPEGCGVWGLIGLTMVSGLIAGFTINAIFAFGEEIGWRGYLLKLFKGKKFITAAIWTGMIWGLWHAPLILNGHNYPQHPVIGVFMMMVSCTLFTPILMYFRIKSGSVIVPSIMHGTINAVAGISIIMITPANDLLYGCTGLAGFITILTVDLLIFIYDRYISKENLMQILF